MASFHAIEDCGGGTYLRPFGVYTSETSTSVEVPLGGSAMKAPPFDQDETKRDLVRRLNAIDGIRIADDLRKRPSIQVATLSDGDRLQRFLAVMDWAVQQVKAADVPTARP
jgi:hypothetical protein